MVADGGRKLRGELGEVRVDVVGEMVFEGDAIGVEVGLAPTFKLRLEIGLNVPGDRPGLEEALVEVCCGGIRRWLVRSEGGELAFGYGEVGSHVEIGEDDAVGGRKWGGEG